jgi:hypothetical protein
MQEVSDMVDLLRSELAAPEAFCPFHVVDAGHVFYRKGEREGRDAAINLSCPDWEPIMESVSGFLEDAGVDMVEGGGVPLGLLNEEEGEVVDRTQQQRIGGVGHLEPGNGMERRGPTVHMIPPTRVDDDRLDGVQGVVRQQLRQDKEGQGGLMDRQLMIREQPPPVRGGLHDLGNGLVGRRTVTRPLGATTAIDSSDGEDEDTEDGGYIAPGHEGVFSRV